ncbi:carbohydrate ABC transporter permease [Candidatus Halocynthiibacter alkanivorans]|jgi:inositol-phosphate transport system permease protein|uniref:carbohydrate ABC transporter permease n=1 Tax=Candidatus Halocynthiibacter alkanivorans TaxID=2267619 RepID=UPI000DF381D8|nr:carbohydrate ABC transporter permease [Candidatus Halocynthiibacter alkanivorans]
MTGNYRKWPMILFLGILTAPIILMYFYLFVDTVTNSPPGSMIPNEWTAEHWRFLFTTIPGRPSIWTATLNTLLFATTTTSIVLVVSSAAGYALSRLNMPGRSLFLGGVLVLHAFPTVTLLIAIFLILQMVGLYNTLIGVILVKTALELPFGIWIMKGFYDTVPWEIEMAGLQDGATRFQVWTKLVLPQVKPAIMALGIFSFLAGWSEFILPLVLAPDNNVQVLSVYLAGLISDDTNFDMAMFKSVGVFYVLPVIILFTFFQSKLMNIYSGGNKG